jgi:DNA-binding GntR family transcriptional regulator
VNKNVFARIEARTVQGTVVDLVRDAIISGVLQPGEKLTESTVARQMEVSRAPLREALRELEQEGLILRVPNRGCVVVSLDERDIAEIFSLRCELECMAIRLAVPNLTAGDFETLRAIIEASRQTIQTLDLDQLTRLDMQFHEYITSRAGHSRLMRAWHTNNHQARMLLNSRFRTLSDYTPETVIPDHTSILDALSRRDTDAAIAITEQISARVVAECKQIMHNRANGRLVAAK